MSYTLLNRNCCAFVLYEMISIVENGACIYTCLIKKRVSGCVGQAMYLVSIPKARLQQGCAFMVRPGSARGKWKQRTKLQECW